MKIDGMRSKIVEEKLGESQQRQESGEGKQKSNAAEIPFLCFLIKTYSNSYSLSEFSGVCPI